MTYLSLVTLLLSAPIPVPTAADAQPANWRDATTIAVGLGGYFGLHSRPLPFFTPDWADSERSLAYREDTVPTATFYGWAGLLSLSSGLEGGSKEAASAVQTIALTALSTEVLKYSFGRPRPDYTDRLALHAAGGDEKLLRDSRLSMPSGHASAAFALALHSGLWMHRAGCRRGWSSAAVVGGYAAPLLIATAIAISRISDNRHNPSDVLVGAALGGGVAYGVNRVQFGKPRGCASP